MNRSLAMERIEGLSRRASGRRLADALADDELDHADRQLCSVTGPTLVTEAR